MGGQLKKIKVGEMSTYDKPELRKRFTDNPNVTYLDLGGKSYTDQDMEIVAYEIEVNTVRKHLCFFFIFDSIDISEAIDFI